MKKKENKKTHTYFENFRSQPTQVSESENNAIPISPTSTSSLSSSTSSTISTADTIPIAEFDREHSLGSLIDLRQQIIED